MAGYNYWGEILCSYNTGNVHGSSCIGGLLGENNTGTIINSYNTGNVSSYSHYGASNIGGIAGNNGSGVVNLCYNAGNVSGHNIVGGVTGGHTSPGAIANCLSLGKSITANYSVAKITVGNGSNYYNNAREDIMVISYNNTYTNNGGFVYLGTPISSIFYSNDTGVWSIPASNLTANCALPTLLNMPPGTQNPKLQP